MLKIFYRIMAAWTKYDLAIARTYSENSAYVRNLSDELEKWEGLLAKEEINEPQQ